MAPQEEKVVEVLEREKINSVPAVKNKGMGNQIRLLRKINPQMPLLL